MRTMVTNPPRTFRVGTSRAVTMTDCGRVELEPDEQVTFVTPQGAEYDVARKSWGFYATPSLNHRLPRLGLRAALVRNRLGHIFVVLVERGHESEFGEYVTREQLVVDRWFDRASLDEAGFDRASLDEAGFDRARFDRASLDEASLDEASLDEASLDEPSGDGQ